MGGLKNFFLKLTPIMLLICCICYGILHTFQTEGESNITYLTQESINIGTEENPEYKILYKFDMVSYTQNIDQNILKRSVEHTLTLEAYQWTLDQFNDIWQDGYQVFDVSKTIANGIVLVINTLILPINILLVPLRIIAGILLTGMSLVGINIENGIIICPLLTFILDKLAVPFIAPNTLDPSSLDNQVWQFSSNINELYQGDQEIEFEFIIQNDINHIYDKIKIENYSSTHIRMSYHIKNGTWTTIYDSGKTGNAWYNKYNTNSKIQILANSELTQQQESTITAFLQHYGTQTA